jgi:hypothetical protein
LLKTLYELSGEQYYGLVRKYEVSYGLVWWGETRKYLQENKVKFYRRKNTFYQLKDPGQIDVIELEERSNGESEFVEETNYE